MKKVIAVLMVLVVYAGFAFAGEKARDGRFIAYDNGTILDTQTNLMWAAKDNGKHINWQDAKSYCENYRGAGYTDWRMPTQDELAGLYDPDKSYRSKVFEVHLTKLIQLSDGFVWTSETRGSDAAFFSFSAGGGGWYPQSSKLPAFPVRSGKTVTGGCAIAEKKANASGASAQQWTLVCNGKYENMYYDSNSVKHLPDNKVGVLIKTVTNNELGESYESLFLAICQAKEQAKRNNNGEKCFYTEEQEELNCNTNESRRISKTFYDKNGNILCKDSEETKWSKIAENTCDRLAYQALCK